jgi:potassium efflux system protein
MFKLIKSLLPACFCIAVIFSPFSSFSQTQDKKVVTQKRAEARLAMRKRDSVMRTLNKSDTSASSLLQKIEQYTTTFNQIKNSLSKGLDTFEVSRQLPPVVKRIEKISNIAAARKAGTLRYLFVLRDNLDRAQEDLEKWQSDLEEINAKSVQNQHDLLKFSKDTLLKTNPSDSLLRNAFFIHRREIGRLWHGIDSTNRRNLLKINLLQDKVSGAYTRTLDETDQVDNKIKEFAMKALSGESDYIWQPDSQFDNFDSAFNTTIRLNKLLFNFFIKSASVIHLIAFIFFILIFTWIIFSRSIALKNQENTEIVAAEAPYIFKSPIISPLLVTTAIIPCFYSHPPTIFVEVFLVISIILSLALVRKHLPLEARNFLAVLFLLALFYAISNLFIEISNIDRYFILLLSLIAIAAGIYFYRKVKTSPNDHLPNTVIVLKLFIALQVLSLILNVTGRFSLAKIIGVTAVFNLWLLIIFFLIIKIILQALFLHFQIKKGDDSLINWIDYDLVQKKFKNFLIVIATLLWLFFMMQNLGIDDWARDYLEEILNQSRAIGGATFTFGGFVIFVFVIWLSSIASRVISYFYDVSGRRVTDLSVLKRKNRTSVIIIKIAVFSIGFLLAVGASGFPLDKLTIIISAFGVGIGFGLQNIVNNLVSGLILAFEKPINIGDIIEVDGHLGTMKEIGIRSSKVLTGDGSEVIIPNGDFISHQVVNWTLSNNNRQTELRIITAYGIDISQVKDLLKNVLSNRKDIMNEPAPAVFVININESVVEFKILFWVADINTTVSLKSKVLTEIHQAINKAGIPLPATKKDIYLHFPEGVPLTNSIENNDTGKIQLSKEKVVKGKRPGPGQ